MEKITSYKSTSGTTHATEYDALRDDLTHVIAKAAENNAIATKIMDALTAKRETFGDFYSAVCELWAHRPVETQGAPISTYVQPAQSFAPAPMPLICQHGVNHNVSICAMCNDITPGQM